MNFEHSVFIKQPVARVFEFVTNMGNNRKWQTGVLEVEPTSPGSLTLGATYRCVNKFMGQRIETEGTVIDFLPLKICSFKITSGSVTGESSFIFEPVDGGTQFTTIGRLDLSFFKLAKIIVQHKARRQLKNDMHNLKTILENGHSS